MEERGQWKDLKGPECHGPDEQKTWNVLPRLRDIAPTLAGSEDDRGEIDDADAATLIGASDRPSRECLKSQAAVPAGPMTIIAAETREAFQP